LGLWVLYYLVILEIMGYLYIRSMVKGCGVGLCTYKQGMLISGRRWHAVMARGARYWFGSGPISARHHSFFFLFYAFCFLAPPFFLTSTFTSSTLSNSTFLPLPTGRPRLITTTCIQQCLALSDCFLTCAI
jgi:hypothetical protein